MYWGVMEQYSLLHEPNASLRGHPFVGFRFRPAKRACADRRGGEGPFSFAKGPLHALSAPLAAQLVAARPFDEYVARVRAHPDEEDGAAAHYFEDAYTGWAVSKFARGDNLTVVHAGQFLYWDQWGSHYQGPRRGTVIFHARLKNGGVMRRADDMTGIRANAALRAAPHRPAVLRAGVGVHRVQRCAMAGVLRQPRGLRAARLRRARHLREFHLRAAQGGGGSAH